MYSCFAFIYAEDQYLQHIWLSFRNRDDLNSQPAVFVCYIYFANHFGRTIDIDIVSLAAGTFEFEIQAARQHVFRGLQARGI